MPNVHGCSSKLIKCEMERIMLGAIFPSRSFQLILKIHANSCHFVHELISPITIPPIAIPLILLIKLIKTSRHRRPNRLFLHNSSSKSKMPTSLDVFLYHLALLKSSLAITYTKSTFIFKV